MGWGTWQPSRVERQVRVLGSSMNTVQVVTDLGEGYLKALGNEQGEHALACELIGTSLAEWIGLPCLDYALLEIGQGDEVFLDTDESKPLGSRRRARPGQAFITRALVPARQWSGDPEVIARLIDPGVAAGLVLLDTWIANPDRHPRRPPDASISPWEQRKNDNVLLHRPKGARKDRLVAMDFSVCLHCKSGGLRRSYDLSLVRDDGIYGLFPEFEPCATSTRVAPYVARLRDAQALRQYLVVVMDRIPREWDVEPSTRSGVQDFLCARAAYLADNFVDNLLRVVPPASD